jgi:hypothetical protein
MTVKLAVCLLTADRPKFTRRTVESFVEFNEIGDLILLHADDGSVTAENARIAQAGGFKTVYENKSGKRLGQIPALSDMWRAAAKLGASHILHLENDIESVAPLPSRRDAQSVRLYGEWKGLPGARRSKTGTHIIGTKERIVWKPEDAEWDRGVAHWGGQPSITETDILLAALPGSSRIKDLCRKMQRLDTLRPKTNVMLHVDHVGTPNHWLGKR